jgi:small subunit ribosomal protein S16
MGAKKSPFYRIVVADSRDRRDGREIEVIGNYDPRKNPAVVNIDEEKTLKWLNNGALPSDTVRNILSKQGIMKKYQEGKKAAK